MKFGVKHENQQKVIRADFSGGLNTSANADGIAENQLSLAVNVEVDHATGRLKTVAGTVDIWHFPKIFAAAYDEINRKLLIVNEDKKVYAADFSSNTISGTLGTLSGELYPICTAWEDGLLIASGGRLQYFTGTKLQTINSPNATAVYVRAGRILIADENSVHYSGVGDENNWTEDTGDDSSSKFVEAGYKDGGQLLGMTNLSSDVLLIKNNRRVYRLSGEFPNWAIAEVSRNVEVSGRLSICSVADSVFILGRNELQNIQTTNAYGDMKPQNVATLITDEIQLLPANAILRYVPPLNQLWIISGRKVLLFDLVTQSWYKREFNSAVVDVISIGNEVLVIKKDRVSRLDGGSFSDAGEYLNWRWQGQRMISQYDYLLKRVQVSIIPQSTDLIEGEIRVGAVVVELPINDRSLTTKLRYLSSKTERVYKNRMKVYLNPTPVFNRPTLIKENRNVYRNKFLDIGGHGTHGGMIFNSIILDMVEV